jgi:SHS2 domain-containing protein
MTTRGRPPYQVLAHTADLGLLVRAPSGEALFERMAAAVFDVMLEDMGTVEPGPHSVDMVLEAPDREALLVVWLNELISRSASESIVFSEFEVSSLGVTRIQARAAGEPIDPRRHRFEREVKAATHYYVLVSEDDDGWSGRVILDV